MSSYYNGWTNPETLNYYAVHGTKGLMGAADTFGKMSDVAGAGSSPQGFWGKTSNFLGALGKGASSVAGGAAKGASIGAVTGNPYGIGLGALAGGLMSLPGAVSGVWDAAQAFRNGGRSRGRQSSTYNNDLSLMDTELLTSENAGRTSSIPSRMMTSGVVPMDSMNVYDAYQALPSYYSNSGRQMRVYQTDYPYVSSRYPSYSNYSNQFYRGRSDFSSPSSAVRYYY